MLSIVVLSHKWASASEIPSARRVSFFLEKTLYGVFNFQKITFRHHPDFA
jgi:hypothetical protein